MASYDRDEDRPELRSRMTYGPRDWYLPALLIAGAAMIVIVLALMAGTDTAPNTESTGRPPAVTPAPALQPEK